MKDILKRLYLFFHPVFAECLPKDCETHKGWQIWAQEWTWAQSPSGEVLSNYCYCLYLLDENSIQGSQNLEVAIL